MSAGLEKLRESAPECLIFNHYGPTETTVGVSTYPITRTLSSATVPIGRAIGNTALYVLDAALKPVPVGVAGELYIGGAGVGRGYIRQPDLTAERFIPNLYSEEGGARLYRTGDMVCWLRDGTLAYLGRRDQQVKVRGFRIEVNEIESVLHQHPTVQGCVVIVREDAPNDKRLVAYVVNARADRQALRAWLRERLPDYMVPSQIVLLDTLPLMPNGKLDRAALPQPIYQGRHTSEALHTSTEAQLLAIWQSVLRLETIGIDDNFFELGGDSILAIQVVARALEQNLKLRPAQLFRHQTVAQLAAVAEPFVVVRHSPAPSEVMDGEIPLSPIQHWFFEQNIPAPHHWNQALMLAGPAQINEARLRASVLILLAQHDALRLRFTRDEQDWHAWYDTLPEDQQSFVMEDLRDLPTDQQVATLEQRAAFWQRQFSLEHVPLLRVVLFFLNDTSRLLLIVHHLIVDGISWRVLLDNLQRAYTGKPLPPKSASLGQWNRDLVNYAQQPEIVQDMGYWTAHSWGGDLPTDYPFNFDQHTVGQAHGTQFRLDTATTSSLLQQIPRRYRTQIDDILLTALVQTLCLWANQPAITIDVEGHGRDLDLDGLDVSRTIGWFTALYPVTLSVRDAPLAGLLAVKETLRSVPHHGISYGLLRYLNSATAEQLSQQPTPSVSFNYLGQLDQSLENGLFQPAVESIGAVRSPEARRLRLFDIVGYVVDHQLQFDWIYSPALHYEKTIELLGTQFLKHLQRLVAACLESPGGFTPSDFPLAGLSQPALDTLAQAVADPLSVETVYPLSPLQQGLLFHSLYETHAGVYIEQVSFTLLNVDWDAFVRAWQTVLNQSPILRTSFHWKGLPGPQQVVHRRIDLPVALLSADAADATAWSRIVQVDRERGFELEQAPLLRLTACQFQGNSYRVLFSFHHLLLDRWAQDILFQAVFAQYQAQQTHTPLNTDLGLPYSAYIAWLQAQPLAQAEEFWRDYLSGFTVPNLLPGKRITPNGPRHDHEHTLRLSTQATAALQIFARSQQITLNTVIQTAWAILLSRYSSQPDVLFGITVSGRPADLPGADHALGLFINTLPLRLYVDPNVTLADCLAAVQAQATVLQAYEYSSLVDVQRWSDLPPTVPLFDSLLVFQNTPRQTSELSSQSDLSWQDVRFFSSGTNYPLTVAIVPANELLINLAYDAAQYAPENISNLAAALETLLTTFSDHANTFVGSLSLLSEAERAQIVNGWNRTQEPLPHLTINALFEAQVRRSPEAVALIAEDETLTLRS